MLVIVILITTLASVSDQTMACGTVDITRSIFSGAEDGDRGTLSPPPPQSLGERKPLGLQASFSLLDTITALVVCACVQLHASYIGV